MDEFNIPKCSHDPDPIPQEKPQQDETIVLKTQQINAPISVSLVASSPSNNTMFLQSTPEAALVIKGSDQMPITTQPRMSTLPSPMSLASPNQPQSLFLQALSQINESSLSFNILNYLQANMKKLDWQAGDVTPPDSLTSAPPSYSFVLRQMAARRRPRLMGTFIPSPSFVQHTPPPTYATAFDIYIDPGPPPPPRVYTYGFTSMPVVCPECGYTGMTVTTSKITVCTHLCAFLLCLFCCWICAPLPYVLRSCKDVYHYCRNCRNYLGMYCPTNPENSYPAR